MNRLASLRLKPRQHLALGAIFAASMAGIAYYFNNQIDLDSSLVNTVILKIGCHEKLYEQLGTNLKPVGKLNGEMNQPKGLASINFDIEGSKEKAHVFVIAHRFKRSWTTDEIKVVQGNGQVTVIA